MQEKAQGIVITQISAAYDGDEGLEKSYVYGLGNDQQVYFWLSKTGKWMLYKN